MQYSPQQISQMRGRLKAVKRAQNVRRRHIQQVAAYERKYQEQLAKEILGRL